MRIKLLGDVAIGKSFAAKHLHKKYGFHVMDDAINTVEGTTDHVVCVDQHANGPEMILADSFDIEIVKPGCTKLKHCTGNVVVNDGEPTDFFRQLDELIEKELHMRGEADCIPKTN